MGGFLFFTTSELILTFSLRPRRLGGGDRLPETCPGWTSPPTSGRFISGFNFDETKSESGDRRRDVNLTGETLNSDQVIGSTEVSTGAARTLRRRNSSDNNVTIWTRTQAEYFQNSSQICFRFASKLRRLKYVTFSRTTRGRVVGTDVELEQNTEQHSETQTKQKIKKTKKTSERWQLQTDGRVLFVIIFGSTVLLNAQILSPN